MQLNTNTKWSLYLSLLVIARVFIIIEQAGWINQITKIQVSVTC